MTRRRVFAAPVAFATGDAAIAYFAQRAGAEVVVRVDIGALLSTSGT